MPKYHKLYLIYVLSFTMLALTANAQKWEGDVSSDWNNQNNWSGNTFPYGQNIVIDAADYTYAPVMSANSSFSVQDITIQGARTTVTFNTNTSISGRGIIVQSGATFNSAATISIYQELTIQGSGTVVNLSGGSIGGRDILVNTGAKLNNSGTSLTAWRDLIIEGANTIVTFTGGSRSGRDVLIRDSAVFYNNGGTFTNYRIVSVSDSGSVINFSAGSFSSADLIVNSFTTFNMTGGTGSFNSDVTVSGGVLNVNGDYATLNIGSDLILLSANSFFNFYKGDVTIGSDLVLSGDACNCNTVAANIYGGELTINGALNVYTKNASSVDYPSLTVSDGVVNIDGVTKSGAIGGRQLINVNGGDVNFTSAFTLDAGDTINQTDGDISMQGTFTNNGMVYNVSGGKISYDGTSYTNIGGSGITEFYELEIDDAAGINITVPIYIKHKLTLTKGVINISGSGAITLRDGATADIGSRTSYVNGPLTKEGDDAFIFPVGDWNKYAPIGMSAPANFSKYTAKYFSYSGSNTHLPDTSLNNVSAKEHWVFNRDSGTANVNVTLYWDSAAFSGINLVSDLVVAEYTGSNWKSLGQGSKSGNTLKGAITSQSSATRYNQYTFGSKSGNVNPLPVEWLYFDALEKNGEVLLEWGTGTEHNNDYFTIERTVDGTNFEVIGTVKGQGNTVNITEYSFTDITPHSGTSFYRIRQVDFNGEDDATKWKKVEIGATANNVKGAVTIYPNPANSGASINYELIGFSQGDVSVTIQTQTGKIVATNTVSNMNGVISLSAIHQPGVYFVTFAQGENRVVKKLIIR